jgi:hypothetical protein
MAPFVAPQILIVVFHWMPMTNDTLCSKKFAVYSNQRSDGDSFWFYFNSIAIRTVQKFCRFGKISIFIILCSFIQFVSSAIQLVLLYLICQFVSPVGLLFS